jgi:GT2 family glycosyltransferase
VATRTRRDTGVPAGTTTAAVPAVSVIVPARNGGRHLRTTLPALRDALPDGWEILLVDDHSTDDTVAVAKLYADRVITSRQEKSGPAARNTGALAARGQLFVFMDQDIRVTRDTLERLVEALDEPGTALAFAVYSEGRYLRTLGGRFKNIWVRWSYLSSPTDVRWMNTALAAIRADDFWSAGAYDNEDDWREGGNDIDFGRLVADRVGRVRLCPHIDCDHLKEMSLWGLLRNDFFRTRGFFRMSMQSNEIKRVAKGRWYGNISPVFMGGVTAAGLAPLAAVGGLAGIPGAWGVAAGAAALQLLLAFPFLAYAMPRLGLAAPLAPAIYLADQAACCLGLATETIALFGRRLFMRSWRTAPSPRF